MPKESSNDRVVLDALVSERHGARAPSMTEDDFFEIFVADEVLREFAISDAEIDRGVVDGGSDGGIDAMYTFVNGELVLDIDDIPDRKDPSIDLIVIQSTIAARFTEDRVGRLRESLDDLLELRADPQRLRSLYNNAVINASRIFSETYLHFAGKIPVLRVRIVYASRGVTPTERSRLRTKAADVRNLVGVKFQDAQASFDFLGARELVQLAHRRPAIDFALEVAQVMSVGRNAYVALVGLTQLNKMISDGSQIRAEVFDANVRDYEGNVEVNRGIRQSLENPGSIEDFWWLNNGITVLASHASLAGTMLTLKDPQIVNGFQTSTEIAHYLRAHGEVEDRAVLTRVFSTESEEVRDRIIRATNSQTAVGVFALRSTDPLHHDLETYLRRHSLFYERRKNFHKNRARPRSKIVSVADMAQAVMATVLFRPDDSRARPSSLVKDDATYQRVFDPAYPLDAYLKAISLLHRTRDYLAAQGLSALERNNNGFHVAMAVSALMGVRKNDAASLAALDLDMVDNHLPQAHALVSKHFKKAIRSGLTDDQAAKSRKVAEAIAKDLGVTS